MSFLVRIKPEIPCNSFNEFFKAKGWYEVDESKAAWCRTRRINDLTPDAPLVFDVKTQEEAIEQVQVEQKRVDPSGTPNEPIRLPTQQPDPDQTPATPPAPPPAARGGQSRGGQAAKDVGSAG